ncbi:MAG TPA: ABC transporter permease, partial [Actinotalea sp.]|nr:ABC transporter permease [Actinotalea sp.]
VAGDRIGFDLPTDQTVRVLVGGPLYLLAVAVLALAVGALIRHTAGAISALIGLLLVIEPVFANVPLRVLQEISPFLPRIAGQQLLYDDASIAIQREFREYGAILDPWVGYGILVAWAALALVAAAVLLRRRDA